LHFRRPYIGEEHQPNGKQCREPANVEKFLDIPLRRGEDADGKGGQETGDDGRDPGRKLHYGFVGILLECGLAAAPLLQVGLALACPCPVMISARIVERDPLLDYPAS